MSSRSNPSVRDAQESNMLNLRTSVYAERSLLELGGNRVKFVCGSQGSRIYRFVMTHWMVSWEGRGSPRCKFGVVTLVHRIICFTWPGTASVPPFNADLSLNVLLRRTLFTAFSLTSYLLWAGLGRTVSFICFCLINYGLLRGPSRFFISKDTFL